ncbi:EAL domain-containing protein [Salmonella enterica subsp. enterica]|nr:EAL domain-containing protein [Salmonella enterica subsp. enterica]
MSFSPRLIWPCRTQELEPFCQPLLNARTRCVPAFSRSCRWNNLAVADPPRCFIPIAEEHNLIAPLTRYVITQWKPSLAAALLPHQPSSLIGINVAAKSFPTRRASKIFQSVLGLCGETCSATALEFHGTRRVASDVDYRLMREPHRKGVKLAIDDFGTETVFRSPVGKRAGYFENR